MLRHSELRRINRVFEHFGRVPNGALRIMWKDLSELFYFIEKDQVPEVVLEKVDRRTKTGKRTLLYGVRTIWERHTWQERYGQGYCLCVWQPAPPRDQWVLRYGSMAPYQENGEYHLMENTVRTYDDPPTTKNSELLKSLLLDMFYRGVDINGGPMKSTGTAIVDGKEVVSNEVLDTFLAQQKREQEEIQETINREIDDLRPAFGNYTPGKRGHNVSFGGLISAEPARSSNRIIIPG